MYIEITGKQIIGTYQYYELKTTEYQNYSGSDSSIYYSYLRKSGDSVFANENDIDQLMYRFDADSGDTWLYIRDTSDIGKLNYQIFKKNVEYNVNGNVYKECIVILSRSEHVMDSELYEIFAPNIGLIQIEESFAGYYYIIDYSIITDVSENDNPKKNKVVSDYQIYPNPVTDNLQISCSTNSYSISSEKNMIIQIISALGVTVKTFELNSDNHNHINVSELPSGVYFLKVGDNVYKFVKI